MIMKTLLIKLVQDLGEQLELRRRQKDWSLIDKGEDGVATSADIEAEKTIVSFCQKHFPEIKSWGEEQTKEVDENDIDNAGKYWLIDPIDGTNNFVNGLGFYCISIALCQGRDILLGLVYNPVEKTYFFAKKNEGAIYFNGIEEVALSGHKQKKASECLFSPGRLRAKREPIGIESQILDPLQQECRAIRRLGAAAWEICLCAGGILDGFWQYGLKPWDIAAGLLIARESGLIVRDYDNLEATPFSKTILVLPEHLMNI